MTLSIEIRSLCSFSKHIHLNLYDNKFTSSYQFLTCLINSSISIACTTVRTKYGFPVAQIGKQFMQSHSGRVTNGKIVLLSSLLFVYEQLVHRKYVLMVYCKQLLKGAQNIASASKNSEASCCLFIENGARSSLRTYLLDRRSTFVGST